jgi:hypothetical protein
MANYLSFYPSYNNGTEYAAAHAPSATATKDTKRLYQLLIPHHLHQISPRRASLRLSLVEHIQVWFGRLVSISFPSETEDGVEAARARGQRLDHCWIELCRSSWVRLLALLRVEVLLEDDAELLPQGLELIQVLLVLALVLNLGLDAWRGRMTN